MAKKKTDRDGVFMRRGSYYISFTDAQGRRKQRKLKGVISLTEAKQLRNEELRNAEKARTLGYSEPSKDSFAQFLPAYLKYQERRIEASSYQRARAIAESHLMPVFGPMRLASIRRLDADRYITDRLGEVSTDTVVKEVNVLKGILTRAVEEEKIPFNPLRGFGKKTGMPQEKAGRVRYLEPKQLRTVLAECPQWLRPIVGLLIATGMRRSECLTLRWWQVHRDQNQIQLPKTKTHKERTVHLSDLACKALDSIPRASAAECVFGEVTPENVSLTFLRACRRAGIEDFRLHDLRHSCASWMRMRGADLQDVAKQLGHSDLRMSDRYANLSQVHLLAAVKKADGVFAGVDEFFPIPCREADHASVTIEQENSTKVRQTAASMKQAVSAPIYLPLPNLGEVQQTTAKEL